MRFGLHVSIAGGIDQAVSRAQELGCDCFQIFLASPRMWNNKRISDEMAHTFINARSQADIGPVAVHLTYLPNLATPFPDHWKNAVDHLIMQYEDAAKIGADYLVLHPGSARGGRHDKAVSRCAKAISKALKTVKNGPTILLENTAGAGSSVGAMPEDLAEIDRQVGKPDRVGMCLDTAHAVAAGLNLLQEGAMSRLLARLTNDFGRNPVKLVHLNDLRAAAGVGVDRHEHLGQGTLGEMILRDILHAEGLQEMDFILETPVENEGDDKKNLQIARKFAGLL